MNETLINAEDALLGIDIGKVIIGRSTDGNGRIFNRDDLASTPFVESALESLSELQQLLGAERIYLISKCTPPVQRLTNILLERKNFYGQTKLLPENVRYTATDTDKANVAESLGVNFFIDDKVMVLRAMANIVRHRYLFMPHGTNSWHIDSQMNREDIVIAKGWPAVVNNIEQNIAK